MAVNWIKIESVTPEKPEVFQIAAILDMDPEKVFAKLFKVWRWVDQLAVDGKIARVKCSLVDYIAGHSGFAKAMIEVGWLEETADVISIPNFDRHLGDTAKQRGLGAKRNEKYRSKGKGDAPSVTTFAESDAPSVTNTVTDSVTNVTREPSLELIRIEEKRKEEKTKTVSTTDQQPSATTEDDDPSTFEDSPSELKKPNFAETKQPWSADAEELAWHWKSLLRRGMTNPDMEVGSMFDEWMRQGVSKESILAEIKNPKRLRTEPIWELQKRLFPKATGPPGQGMPGSKAEAARKLRNDIIFGKGSQT